MADRKHAHMDGMQPPGANAVRDRAGVEPDLDELTVGDNAVLTKR